MNTGTLYRTLLNTDCSYVTYSFMYEGNDLGLQINVCALFKDIKLAT